MSEYANVQVGQPETLEYRVFITNAKSGVPVSPFHDIPLWADKEAGIVNMISEIPRGTRAKLEVSRPEPMNPILQDTKKGKLRFIHDPYPFNYGALPQTWEDPNHVHPVTNAKGDVDPLDACEVGSAQAWTGQIRKVKVLGCWAMIDDGETDWKILCIDVTDPLASKLNDVDDLLADEDLKASKITTTYEFLRDYKIPAGSGPNQFAFDGVCKNKAFAMQVIEETHAQWQALIDGKTAAKTDDYEISLANTTLKQHVISEDDARAYLPGN